jgi:GTPase
LAASEKVYLADWIPSRRATAAAEQPPFDAAEDAIEELRDLAISTGAQVTGSLTQRSPVRDPATLIGRGKVAELRAAAHAQGAQCVVFNCDLTPTQLRNLEDALGLKVLDRTQLILDIFARRAQTREGKLQVELAQLTYLLPRLAGHGKALSRLGGGIGTRGPGEQQLEVDRRRARARIQSLKQALERVRSQRSLHRSQRQHQNFLTVALVGYTNAGKSTLFNALTGARTAASARMFATLDPTVRSVALQSRRKALLSDTVGFIRHLPPHLIAAFRATLEELDTAALLLHVTDASHPDNARHDRAVTDLLESLGLAAKPRLHVWNKIDLVPEPARRRIPREPGNVLVSAHTGFGVDDLLRQIDQALNVDPLVETSFEFSPDDARGIALLHRSATVLSSRLSDHRVVVRVRVPESLRVRLASALGSARATEPE